ncbi:hypothetical protein EMIT0P171_120089 [Pseudomonas sp. IT-P171]
MLLQGYELFFVKPSPSPRLDKRGENAWSSDGIEPRSGSIEAYRGAEIRLLHFATGSRRPKAALRDVYFMGRVSRGKSV